MYILIPILVHRPGPVCHAPLSAGAGPSAAGCGGGALVSNHAITRGNQRGSLRKHIHRYSHSQFRSGNGPGWNGRGCGWSAGPGSDGPRGTAVRETQRAVPLPRPAPTVRVLYRQSAGTGACCMRCYMYMYMHFLKEQ